MDREQQRAAFRAGGASHVPPVPVDLGGDIGVIHVRALTWPATREITAANSDDDPGRSQLRVIAASLFTTEGVALFDAADDADVDIVADLTHQTMMKIGEAIGQAAKGKDLAQTTAF